MVFLLLSSFLYTLPYGLLCLFYLFHSAVIFTLSQLLFDCHGLHGFWFFRPLLYFNLFIFWFVIFLFCSSFFSLMFLSFYAFWGLLVDVNSISKGTAHIAVSNMCATYAVVITTVNVKRSVGHGSVGILIFFLPIIIVWPFFVFFFCSLYNYSYLYTFDNLSCNCCSTSIDFSMVKLCTLGITR